MDNYDVVRVPGEPMPNLEEGDRAGSGSESDSDSGSISISNPSSSSDHPASDSDSDSSATSEVSDVELDPFAGSRLVKVKEDDVGSFVKERFLELMSGLGLRTAVETVYKNHFLGLTWQAKLRAFHDISRNMEITVGEGFGKTKYAWFGGPKHEIDNIFRSGFASRGRGLCLSAFHSPIAASLRGCVADENGLCHIVLCRVILGRSELVPPPNVQQQFPSSEEFHSAVDNLASPRVYLIWSSYMNTHVMPQYVVSFRPLVNPLGEVVTFGPPAAPVNPVRTPPIMKPGEFREVGLELAKVLPPIRRRSLVESFKSYRAGKMTKQEMKLKLKELGVDTVLFERLLMSVRRRHGASEEAAPNQAVPLPAQRGSGSRASANRVIKNLRGDRST